MMKVKDMIAAKAIEERRMRDELQLKKAEKEMA